MYERFYVKRSLWFHISIYFFFQVPIKKRKKARKAIMPKKPVYSRLLMVLRRAVKKSFHAPLYEIYGCVAVKGKTSRPFIKHIIYH